MNNLTKEAVLQRYFGHSSFRTGQDALINAICAGRDVLGIMPTGAGKSICYQVPAMLLPGITIVVSPLISLMQDQVAALRTAGIPAAYLNSTMTGAEYFRTLHQAEEGRFKLLYVAPERLLNETFLKFAHTHQLSMVTVDEAHCVSQWGQDFRPSYLKIVTFIESLPYRPVVSAFTATATAEVREDISHILKQKDPFVLTTGFDRENLSFSVMKPANKLNTLKDLLSARKGSSGIVYCLTRKTVEEVCSALQTAGFSATRYHAGLTDEERHANQDDFIYDRRMIMVATNAFGMGIDKSNVSFVIHYNMPKNPEGYYQEAGRAGRDGEPAECILLYNGQDVRTNQFLIERTGEDSDLTGAQLEFFLTQERARLKMMTFYCTTGECLRGFLLRYFGETPPHFCGNCSNCNTHFEAVDMTVDAQKIVSCVYRLRQRNLRFGKNMIVDILCGSKKDRLLQMQLDSLSTYGIMAEYTTHKVRVMLEHLIAHGYLELTDEAYPVVEMNREAVRLLKEHLSVTIRLPKEAPKTEHLRQNNELEEKDVDLFRILRKLRAEYAAKEHAPAYVVFTDASLRDMARQRPMTKEQFLRISGVGEKKADKYSKAFCQAIREYTEANNHGT